MTFQTLIPLFRKNLIATIGGFAILLCCGVYFVRDEHVTRLATEYDDLDVRRVRILKNLKYGDGLPADLAAITEMEKDARSRLFNPRDLAANYNYFFQIESATGVKLANLAQFQRPDAKPAKGSRKKRRRGPEQFSPVAFEMNVTGSYEQVLDFMKHLEGGKAYCRLDNIAVGPSGNGNEGASQVTARVSVDILGIKS